MKKFIAAILVLLATNVSILIAQSRSEMPLYRELTKNKNRSASVSALERVLKTPENFSAGILYFAAGVAFREKRLEDAGFLFYAAQLRRRFDNALFPPVGTGGDDPMVALAALQQKIGAELNRAVMSEPKVFAKALTRVKSWQPKVAANYKPGWDYSKKTSEKQAVEATADGRRDFIDHMEGFCTLLQDAEYFAAFRTGQDYNLKFDSKRPSKEAYDAAVQTMERIEKEKGIAGFAELIKKHKVTVSSSAS